MQTGPGLYIACGCASPDIHRSDRCIGCALCSTERIELASRSPLRWAFHGGPSFPTRSLWIVLKWRETPRRNDPPNHMATQAQMLASGWVDHPRLTIWRLVVVNYVPLRCDRHEPIKRTTCKHVPWQPILSQQAAAPWTVGATLLARIGQSVNDTLHVAN
jgi:hypothetical protein